MSAPTTPTDAATMADLRDCEQEEALIVCPLCGCDEISHTDCAHCDEGAVRENIDGLHWETTACFDCNGRGYLLSCEGCRHAWTEEDEEEEQ